MVIELASRRHYQDTEERRGGEGEKREAVEVGEAELVRSRLEEEGRARRLNSLLEAEV